MKKKELLQKINKRLKKKGLNIIFGAFGNMSNYKGEYKDLIKDESYNGVIEKVIRPETGGTFVKFHGCKYLFKGESLHFHLDHMGLAKSLLMRLPILMLKDSFFLKAYIVVLFLFRRKKFWHMARMMLSQIHFHTIRKIKFPVKEYNTFENEIRKAVNLSLAKRIEKPEEVNFFADDPNVNDKYEKFRAIKCLTDILLFILHVDDSYRYRGQDILSELDQDYVRDFGHPMVIWEEVGRLIDLLISRETADRQTSRWTAYKKVIRLLLYVSDSTKEWIRDILLGLNLDKVKMDENDLFFSLLKQGYNVKGMSLKERIDLRNKMNKESGRVQIKVEIAKKGK